MDILGVGVGVGGGVGWDVNVHCDCNHTVRSLALPHLRHATLLRYLALPHIMLGCCTFSCTSTHTSCYEPEQLAMLMVAKLGKEPPNNKCQKNASNVKTWPTTAVSL